MSEAAEAVTAEATETQTESLLTGKDSTDTSRQQDADVSAKVDGEAEAKPETEWQGAPEVYEPFVMPEGLELNSEMLERFQALAMEHDLPQAEAQKYADFGAELVQTAQQETVGQLQEQWQNTLTEWVDEIRNDKEIGGEHLAENLAIARKTISTFGSDALVKTLEETGMTNNPELVRFAIKIGKALSDDSFHTGNGIHSGKAAGMYDYMNKTH
jgi:hypothetical protein